MALDAKNGIYVFDDQPELSKLRGWYDQVRESVARTIPSGSGDQPIRTENEMSVNLGLVDTRSTSGHQLL